MQAEGGSDQKMVKGQRCAINWGREWNPNISEHPGCYTGRLVMTVGMGNRVDRKDVGNA